MRRWVKVVVSSVGLLALAGAGVASAEWLLVRRTPAWYAPDRSTPEQRTSAANRVEDTLARLYNWSAGRHARQVAAVASTSVALPPGVERGGDAVFPLSFTDGQLNAFFDKWSAFQNRRAAFDRYVTDPRIIVQDGHLIVAGQLKEMGVVVSLFLDPAVSADGRVRLTLSKVVAGVVPVPDSFFESQRESLERVLAASLPGDQKRAALDAEGLANGPAATAAMTEMLLGVLRRRPTEPVIFVPVNTSASSPLLPVRISAVTAADHTLSMTAQATTLEERRDLLAEIKRRDDPNAAAAAPSSADPVPPR